ncbi:hypothetical protein [Floccifex sp.]|uniref:hypothetical protein n=1 Tax=Floccifex sp. TaxID=2815810 RepID=UPI003F0CBC7A
MVILITCAFHTGKTLLAQCLLEQMYFPYLLIDHLKMGLICSGYANLKVDEDEQLTTYLWPINLRNHKKMLLRINKIS